MIYSSVPIGREHGDRENRYLWEPVPVGTGTGTHENRYRYLWEPVPVGTGTCEAGSSDVETVGNLIRIFSIIFKF